MTWWQYYGKWLETALTRPSRSDLVITAIMWIILWLGVLGTWYPNLENAREFLVWAIPTLTAVFAAVRLVSAPYSLYKEQDKELRELMSVIDHKPELLPSIEEDDGWYFVRIENRGGNAQSVRAEINILDNSNTVTLGEIADSRSLIGYWEKARAGESTILRHQQDRIRLASRTSYKSGGAISYLTLCYYNPDTDAIKEEEIIPYSLLPKENHYLLLELNVQSEPPMMISLKRSYRLDPTGLQEVQ